MIEELRKSPSAVLRRNLAQIAQEGKPLCRGPVHLAEATVWVLL